MPPFFFFTLRRLLTLRVLQRRLPCTRRQRLYLPLTRALTFLTIPPFLSVALIVTVHLRCLQRTFWILAVGLVSTGGGGGVRAGRTGPIAASDEPSAYL